MEGNPLLKGNTQRVHLGNWQQIDELQQLYDQAPWGYHSLDKDGVFVRINQTELTMLGYSHDEIIGKKKFSDLLTPKSQQKFQVNFPKFKQQGWVRDLEFEMIRQDGTVLVVSLSSTAVRDEAGNYLMSRTVIVDISDRLRVETEPKLAQAKLRDSETRYRLLFDSNPNPIWVFDLETLDFLAVNQAAIAHYGYSRAEFLQMTLTDIRPPEDLEALNQTIVAFTPGSNYSGVLKHYKKNGDLIDVEITANAMIFDDKPAGLVLVKDITESKSAQIKLQVAEARLGYLLSNNPAILYACEATDNYTATFISENVTAMLGYKSREFLEDNRFWANHIHPEDAPLVFAALKHLFEQDSLTHEYRFLHQNGTYRWVRDELKLLRDETGNPLEIVGYWIDITDRKDAEQKIREQADLLAITSDAIFVHDLDNRILFWNQGAERLYGWQSAQMLGKDWRHLLTQEAMSDLSTILQTVMEQGKWQGEIKKITQTDESVIVMSRCSLMLDEAGLPKSILTVDTDITEKKQLEAQFLRAQRLESLGTLASGIAHDLNNVLTPIIGIVQLLPLKVSNLDDQTKRLLQILNNSARRGADLVKQILSFTRGIEGKQTSTQVSHLLLEIQKIIQQTFPKNIELSTNFSQDLWLIAADATLLHQVFMNLCVNARDAMPNGGTLFITTENLAIDENYARMHLEAQVGSYVVVAIADTGIGIPPKVLDHIFDPFFTTKETGKGTGLGLATAMGIIKSHSGFINVYSEVGKGTSFKVYLPATDLVETEIVVNTEHLLGHGELILVVDDEFAVREVTKATLETHGYRAMTADDGIEAIALYAEHKQEISIVLLDLMMPCLDSFTTIRTLCKLDPQVQIIAMSGLATNESVTKTMTEGVEAFLAKPFTAPELLNILAHLCSKN